jgi:ABC-type nitrate/sulfonate/bicarbonate transport system permease component
MKKIVPISIFFVLWELIARSGLVHPLLLPPPTLVLIALLRLIYSGELFVHIEASMVRALTGFALGSTIGVFHGILIAWLKNVDEISSPLIDLFRPVPIAALIPVFILWFGIGDASKIALITYGCYFPTVLNTMVGVKNVDASLIKVAKLYAASRIQILTKVVLPAAFPYILVGLRYALSLSLILLVISEMIAASSGLGYLILDAEYTFKTDVMFAGIVTIGTIGFLLNEITIAIENRLTKWKRGIRAIEV